MSERCPKCDGTGFVNLGTRSDAEYHSCPLGCPIPDRLKIWRPIVSPPERKES